MTSEEKNALFWIKEHQPTTWSSAGPPKQMLSHLRREHLIEPHGRRPRNGGMTFVLTQTGKKALAEVR